MATVAITTDGSKLQDGGEEEGEEIGEKEGQYFVDQATGQYYFQTSDGETMTVVSAPGVEEPTSTKTATSKPNEGANNQVMMSTGASSDQYQTVTIVPSDGDTGEVSYVLIVQQPEDEKAGGSKSGTQVGGEADDVYDFDGDPDDPNSLGEFITDDKKTKGTGKRSQTVTQAHMCNYCNYTTPKRYLLSRHMKSHSEERPHKCSVCERGFKTLASLQNHVNTHTGTKPHHCKFCQAAFTTSGELVRHVRYRHTYEKPHKCTECDYASVELSKLKRHIRCHTGERPYQCSHCTYASPDTFKLKRHMRIHTGEKPYKCDICSARFTQSNSLKAHRLIHTGDKPVFQCELCPTTCGRKTDLRLHVQKLHTAVQPVHCKMCGKAFPDRYTLKVHKKTHEGERCFKCDLCPYSSISQRHLESHMLIHTDQKPFECDQCDQSFRQRQLLKRHQNLYHNPNYVAPEPKEKTHECPHCSRSFRHKGNLIRHMDLHDPDSTAKEKAIALKAGRQKKIQIIDGQQVEVLGEEGDNMEEYEDENILLDENALEGEQGTSGNVMAVQTSDGQQQYIVLEITQLNEGEEAVQQESKVQQVLQSSSSTSVTLDVPVSKSEVPGAVQVVKDDAISVQTTEKNEPVSGSRPRRSAKKNEGVVGKKSQPPLPSSDEESSLRERGKRKAKGEPKEDTESPNKKTDMANCFGFESDDDNDDIDFDSDVIEPARKKRKAAPMV